MTKQTAESLKYKGILVAALAASQLAAEKHEATLPAPNSRGFDCGFAWVVIKPARGPFVKECKALGIGETRDYGGGGFQIWYSKTHNLPTQSISTHEAACRAFAEVCKANGIDAYMSSRLD